MPVHLQHELLLLLEIVLHSFPYGAPHPGLGTAGSPLLRSTISTALVLRIFVDVPVTAGGEVVCCNACDVLRSAVRPLATTTGHQTLVPSTRGKQTDSLHILETISGEDQGWIEGSSLTI